MCAAGRTLSRRSLAKVAGATLALGALTTLPSRTLLADDAAQPGDTVTLLEGEGAGVRFRANISGLDTGTLDLAYEVEMTDSDKAATSVAVTLRPKDTDGFNLDDVRFELDLGGTPPTCGAPRVGTVRVVLSEPASSVELTGIEAELIDAVWSESEISVYVLLEEPAERANDLTLLVAASNPKTRVSQLVLHASVRDSSVGELGTPSLAVVPADGEALELSPSVVVLARLPWRENAASWEVTGADVTVEGGNVTYSPSEFPTVELGAYPQGANSEVEPIEWNVLAEESGRQLLLSKYVLDAKPYNDGRSDVTWETCTLRAWLNSDFLNSSLSTEERTRVAEVELDNPDNPDYGTPGGNGTRDRVFCLSVGEAMDRFGVRRTWDQLEDELGDDWYDADGKIDYARIYAEEPGYKALVAHTTDYAVSRGAYVWEDDVYDEYDGGSRWWLRSPGDIADFVARVHSVGYVDSHGVSVSHPGVGVRPALWLSL